MASLDDRARLDIAEIAFHGVFIFLELFVAFKQGLGRNGAWFLLFIFSALRLAAASCDLAARQGQPNRQGLVQAYIILTSFGLSLLLAALNSVINRVNASMHARAGVPSIIFTLLLIPLLVGIIMAIIGGVRITDASNANTYAEGLIDLKVAVALFLAVYGAILVLLGVTALRFRYIRSGERMLFFGAVAAAPFLLVRLVYASIQNFDPANARFNRYTPDIYILAFVAVFEEFVVVIVLVVVGFLTPRISMRKISRRASVTSSSEGGVIRRRKRRRRRSKGGGSRHSSRSHQSSRSHHSRSPG